MDRQARGRFFDVGTDQPQFATVKEGLIGRHLTFVPLTRYRSARTTCRCRHRRQRSKTHRTSKLDATKSPNRTSRPFTTTTNSTTRHRTRQAAAGSPAANNRLDRSANIHWTGIILLILGLVGSPPSLFTWSNWSSFAVTDHNSRPRPSRRAVKIPQLRRLRKMLLDLHSEAASFSPRSCSSS